MRAYPAPLQGSAHLPRPPIPARVPVSTSKTGPKKKQRPFAGFPGPRNDWAWIGLVIGVLGALTVKIPVIPYVFGILAVMCGGYAEIASYGWYLDGKGKIPARIAMALGVVLILYLSRGADVL
jgi:hypothetical protein